MADHVRKQIRDHVVTGLSALATTGNRVYAGRTFPLKKDHEPSLLVYTRAETSSRAVQGLPPGLERPCTLHIEGRVCTATPPDDLLDQIAAEVEKAIAAMIEYGGASGISFFAGLAQDVTLISTDIAAKADGDKHIGQIVLQYRVTYCTVEGAPTVAGLPD